MASQPLPLFYRNLLPLSSELHGKYGLKPRTELSFARETHAIPLTVDEFVMAQRFYPIVFSEGDDAVPLALVGLKEGENLFIEADGKWKDGAYIPAYIRRHPFMLARLQPEADQLSLVFDDSWDLVAEDAPEKLFDDSAHPTELTRNVLAFCEQFEQSIARTKSFMDELTKLNLLMEGQAQVQNPGMDQPATFSGFRMIDEKKLQNIRGDQARKMVGNGMMGLIYAHLFSLSQIRELFSALQGQDGSAPAEA